MTRHDADQVITGYVNPTGSGEGNWADETTLGRIRQDGGWDRRYRTRTTDRCLVCNGPAHPRPYIYHVPKMNEESVSLKEFGFALFVISLAVIAFWLWSGILAVML